MFSMTDRVYQIARSLRVDFEIAALLGPPQHKVPVPLEKVIASHHCSPRLLQISNSYQLLNTVRVAPVHENLVREIMTLRSFRDTGFQRAFNCITGEIVSSVGVAGS